ncbi:MAG: hypothetical protein K6F83_09055 [Clostridiales bacterium]|nr:hypothetical protein [Clostridiales bacterium]
MATLCKNCGSGLTFDPKTQMLVCQYCGGSFKAEEVEAEFGDTLEANDITDSAQGYYNCNIYSCGTCGGEIIIHGTEASANCIYCGNSTVVFNRISRQKRPNCIIPFKITKDEALDIIREKFNKGFFVPKAIKNFKAEHVRGIYIPYWIVDAYHSGAVVIRGTVKHGKSSSTYYYGRSGEMILHNLPFDASLLLADESSERLEPFKMADLMDFDEDYLMGFYSNISDVTFGEIRRSAYNRAVKYFNDYALKDVKGPSNKTIVSSMEDTALDYGKLKYAMLPAWFVTYDYEGKHNTILVNGQTGKIVCGIPWNKPLFYSLLIGSGLLLTVLAFILLRTTLPFMDTSEDSDLGKVLVAIGTGAVALFVIGIKTMGGVLKSIRLTQARDIFNFAKKRQE